MRRNAAISPGESLEFCGESLFKDGKPCFGIKTTTGKLLIPGSVHNRRLIFEETLDFMDGFLFVKETAEDHGLEETALKSEGMTDRVFNDLKEEIRYRDIEEDLPTSPIDERNRSVRFPLREGAAGLHSRVQKNTISKHS